MVMRPKSPSQHLAQKNAHIPAILQQPFLLNDLLHLQGSSARNRVAMVSLEVDKSARALLEDVEDWAGYQEGANGRVAGAQALGDGLQVGRHGFLLPGVEGARAAHAGEDFVEDEERAVLVADGLHGGQIAGEGRNGAEGDARDRLEQHGGHAVGRVALELVVQLGGQALHVGWVRFSGAQVAVRVARANEGCVFGEHGLVQGAAGSVTAHAQTAERVAVIAPVAGDDAQPLCVRALELDEVLACHLDGRLDCFAATARHKHLLHDAARAVDEEAGEGFVRGRREVRAERILDLVQLSGHGLLDPGVCVSDAGDGGAS